ncbi:asparagine synthase [Ceratobasidium sp. AG-Ba]|nr:asparagine synthase [Ceratobasidium sp. AG-Ba]
MRLKVSNDENDGAKLFDQIQRSQGDRSALVNIFSQIEGPYAFMYLSKPDQTLYFARDPLGRRSLLIHTPSPSEPFFALCSASNRKTSNGFEEISTAGIFSMPLQGGSLVECSSEINIVTRGISTFAGQMSLNREVPTEESETSSPRQVEEFIARLDDSVKARVANIPANQESGRPKARLGVLFSGGIDCTVVAYLADRHIPPNEPIDLLNVAFENPRTLNAPNKNNVQEERARRKRDKREQKATEPPSVSEVAEASKPGTYDVPDRLTGLAEVEELRMLCPNRQWNFVSVDVSYEESKREEPKVVELMYPSKTVMDLASMLELGTGVVFRVPRERATKLGI